MRFQTFPRRRPFVGTAGFYFTILDASKKARRSGEPF